MPNAPQDRQERVYPIEDLSGGMQATSTPFLRRKSELSYVENGDYAEVGAIGKAYGYAQQGSDLTSTTSTSTSSSTTTTSTSSSTSTSTSTSTTTTA